MFHMIKNKFISIVIIVAFVCCSIVPDASACWWKGLPSPGGPEITGGGAAAGGHNDGQPGQEGAGEPVFLHNGDYVYTHQDMFVPSRGMDFEILRTYKSQSRYNGRFGLGWELNYNKRLVALSNGDVFYFDGEGGRLRFVYIDGVNYLSPAYVFDELVQNPDGTFTLTKKDKTRYNFSADGTLSEIIDRNNNSMSFTYDAGGKLPLIGVPLYTSDPLTPRLIAYQHKLIKITDTVGRVAHLSYDANGRLIKIVNFSGRELNYAYDNSGHLISAKDSAGNLIKYSYTSNRRLHTITDPEGNTYLTNTYNPLSQVIAQTYGEDSFYFSYDTENRITRFTDRKGNVWTYYFDENGNPTRIIDPKGDETTKTYGANNKMLLTTVTYPRGNWVKYSYDNKGNILEVRQKRMGAPDVDDPVNDIVTTFTYEPNFNFIKTITDPKGNVTTYTYDYELDPLDPNYGENGNLITITYPSVGPQTPITSFTYDQYGQLITVTDPNGIVTLYDYDPATGYTTSMTNDYGIGRLNQTTNFGYDSVGNVTSITDANGNTQTFKYDILNRLIRTIATPPFNYQTKYSYDKNGNLTKIERQADGPATTWQTTTYAYDSLDRLKTITDNLANITTFGYDANGNRTSIQDAELNTTTYLYDERDLLWKVTDCLGNVTEYTYDNNKNLNQIKDAKNNTTTYTYDDFDRLITTTYPDSSTESYTYDKIGNLLTKTNRRGQVISYGYDELNRVTTKTTPETTITYSYDVGSRLSSVTDAAGTISYSYDNLNRVISITYPGGVGVSYGYDAVGNRTKLTYPDSSYITYEYDELNRLTRIKDQTPTIIAFYFYDVLSRRTGLDLANNTRTTYGYDGINRLTTLTNTYSPTPNTYSYTHDNVGNRLTKTDTAGSENYTYDNIYQLTNVTYPDTSTTTYNYDEVGNRTTAVNGGTTTYTTNNLNQYTKVGATNYSYDLNANLTFDGTNIYSYDSENRLISATTPSHTAAYTYDAFGRRIQKNVDGTTTNYIYDGDQVILETTPSTTTKYIYGPGIDEPITMQKGGDTYYYHFDGLGSVTALTDSTGETVESYTYDVYGNLTSPLSNVGNNYYFTARRLDPETNLYYYRERYYSPLIGRFLQTDPLGVDDENTYTYCYNDPVNYIDPYGLYSIRETVPGVSIPGIKIGGYETGAVDLGYIGPTPKPGENTSTNPKRISEGKAKKKGEEEKTPAGYLTKKKQEKAKKKKKGEEKRKKKGETPEETRRKIRDVKKNPQDWEKIAEKKENGDSCRELWRNKKTGELLERHRLERPNPKHPHPHWGPRQAFLKKKGVSMSLTKLEYELIKYTVNDEPLHILIGGFANNKKVKIKKLFGALIRLIKLNYLVCSSSDKSQPRPLKITFEDLNNYLTTREKMKERLNEYPEHCWEYSFCATERGISQLREKDRPIKLKVVKSKVKKIKKFNYSFEDTSGRHELRYDIDDLKKGWYKFELTKKAKKKNQIVLMGNKYGFAYIAKLLIKLAKGNYKDGFIASLPLNSSNQPFGSVLEIIIRNKQNKE